MRLARCFIFVATFLMLAGTAVAGPLEDGQAAIDSKDYATAQLLRSLAEQGNAAGAVTSRCHGLCGTELNQCRKRIGTTRGARGARGRSERRHTRRTSRQWHRR